MTFCSHIHGPQRKNSGESGDPLRFTLFGFERKIYYMYIHKYRQYLIQAFMLSKHVPLNLESMIL